MILAAVNFADPLMLAGLLAALVPVMLHLLNRIRAPVVPFSTLRFLKLTAQKTARRRQIQQYFLLLVRVAVFALVAMAVAAPLIRGGSAGLAYGFVVMALGGLVLLVLGGVLTAAAVDARKAAPERTAAPRAGRRYWTYSTLVFAAAMGLAGYAAYGLASDRYFSGDRGEFSGRSTALVVIFDNSHSMLAREDSEQRLARAKREVRALLGEAIRPAEAAIVPTNPGPGPATGAALTRDMTRLVGYLEGLIPTGSARPMQERVRTALEILGGTSQPGKMLVIVSDFARPDFADPEVFSAIKGLPWRKDLQVVLMPMWHPAQSGAAGENSGMHGSVADVGIARWGVAEGSERPVIGAHMTFEAQVVNNGPAADVRELELMVDGKPAAGIGGAGGAAWRVQLGPAGTLAGRATVRIAYRLAEAGVHRYGVQIRDAQDAMAWDDRREVALDVADQVRVLIVGAELPDARGQPRARSAAFYFQAALSPFDDDGKGGVSWPIKPTYQGMDQAAGALDSGSGGRYAAVFLCDVPRVSPELAAAISRYARGTGGARGAGGRIVWVLGPSVDAAAYNQMAGGPEGELLPGPLGQPLVGATALALDWVDVQSGLFAALFDSLEPYRSVLVTGRWTLAGDLARGRVVGRLADGGPVLIEHSAGASSAVEKAGGGGGGQIYTLLTTPAAAWSNLGGTVLLVPLAARMALGGLDESGQGKQAAQTGEPVLIPLDLAKAAPGGGLPSVDVTTPGNEVINVKPMEGAAGEQQAQWRFDGTMAEGVYRWKTSDGRQEGMFAVNPPGQEADVYPADVAALAKETGGTQNASAAGQGTGIVAFSTAELVGQLEQRGEGTSLAPGFIAMVLMLAVVESMMANRHRPGIGAARGAPA